MTIILAHARAEKLISVQIANTTTQTAAQTGLNQANGGVKTIAQSLIAGQQAPDAGRQAVEAGLVAMNSALAGGNA